MEVRDKPGLDDPIWPYLIQTRLEPYIEPARAWWDHVADLAVADTGVYALEGPPGFMMRFTRTAIRSPIRGIQAFPFVLAGFLQLSGIQGGSTKMLTRMCASYKLKIEEFTIIEKHNLPSTYNSGQFLAFIPTDLILGLKELGTWIYFTRDEIAELLKYNDVLPFSIQHKLVLKI
jgi:hypothetical protein